MVGVEQWVSSLAWHQGICVHSGPQWSQTPDSRAPLSVPVPAPFEGGLDLVILFHE